MVCFRFWFKSSFQKFMVISITGLVSAVLLNWGLCRNNPAIKNPHQNALGGGRRWNGLTAVLAVFDQVINNPGISQR